MTGNVEFRGRVVHPDRSNMDQLDGKVAVVTGSASGLGRAMVERFALEGMTVVVADNRLAAAELVAKHIEDRGGRAVAIEVDVTQRDSMIALADRVDTELGGASLLVNNAGVMSVSPILRPEELGWRWIVEVNLFGVIYRLQTFVPRMLASGRDGHVVNTASLAGLIAGNVRGNRISLGHGQVEHQTMIYGYMATKHAVVAISEMLCQELAGTRIGVSVLCPSHHDNTGIYENSALYRPPAYGGPMTPEEVLATAHPGQAQPAAGASTAPISTPRDPAECADRVLRAINEGHFYVFTHPENRKIVEHRFSQIRAGLDDAATFASRASS
jgi:NAD(P)-dependent dehydrogenase (short-subunit alcohol dehydrogenase family)